MRGINIPLRRLTPDARFNIAETINYIVTLSNISTLKKPAGVDLPLWHFSLEATNI